jgi:hypothetical protein
VEATSGFSEFVMSLDYLPHKMRFIAATRSPGSYLW